MTKILAQTLIKKINFLIFKNQNILGLIQLFFSVKKKNMTHFFIY